MVNGAARDKLINLRRRIINNRRGNYCFKSNQANLKSTMLF